MHRRHAGVLILAADIRWGADEQADRRPSHVRWHRVGALIWLVSDAACSGRFYSSLDRTELGTLVRLIPNPDTMDKSEWDYFEMSGHIDSWLIPQKGQPGIFEPIAFVRAAFVPIVGKPR